MNRSRIHLTNEEKVLLHLLRFGDYEGECPQDITQRGMEESLGISQSHVSYAVKSLRRQGLVEEKLAHITGAKRRRKAYVLTEQGYKLARSLQDTIEEMPIRVSEDGGEMVLTLKELKQNLGEDITVLDILKCVSKDGRFLPPGNVAEEEDITLFRLTERIFQEGIKPFFRFAREEADTAKSITDDTIKIGKERFKRTMGKLKRLREKIGP